MLKVSEPIAKGLKETKIKIKVAKCRKLFSKSLSINFSCSAEILVDSDFEDRTKLVR